MSRTPVRDALQRLENEGLVVTSSTRRTSVSPVTLKQARDIYPITMTLESLALRLALPVIDEAALDAMRAANVALAAALAAGNAATATLADEAVHGGFIACCGNDELMTQLRDLKAKVRRLECAFWGWADRTPSVRDHDELIAALAARDGTTAETCAFAELGSWPGVDNTTGRTVTPGLSLTSMWGEIQLCVRNTTGIWRFVCAGAHLGRVVHAHQGEVEEVSPATVAAGRSHRLGYHAGRHRRLSSRSSRAGTGTGGLVLSLASSTSLFRSCSSPGVRRASPAAPPRFSTRRRRCSS